MSWARVPHLPVISKRRKNINNYSKSTIMKKTILSLCVMAVACLTAMSFISCGDDNDDPKVPETPKATEVKVEPVVYVTASTLKYFDVELKDASGKTIAITTDNTVATSASDIVGAPLFSAARALIGATLKKYPSETLRAYKMPTENFKSFPQTLSYSVKATAKSIEFAEGDKINVLAQPTAGITLNAGSYDKFDGTCGLSIIEISQSTSWNRYVTNTGSFTRTVALNFSAADRLVAKFSNK